MLHVYTCLIILHCNNDVYTCYCTVLRLNDANSSRDSRKGIARTSQTCRNVSRVCRKVGARPSQRHRANVANLSQRVARMSQSRRATVAKASRDIPAMPFSATIVDRSRIYIFGRAIARELRNNVVEQV